MTDWNRTLLAWMGVLTLFWLGLLVGVSFLATSVKFLAPSLSLPVALDVGRQTFSALNPLELLLGICLLAVVVLAMRNAAIGRARLSISVILLLLVAAQTVWLLPLLDSRVEIILQGGQPPPSRMHLLYIAADVIKLVLLAVLAAGAISKLVRQHL